VLAYVRRGGPRLPEILSYAERAGCAITDVAVTETTLETVFIQLTGRDLRE
jgi:ABC-2 type transport system ATP-binding protein